MPTRSIARTVHNSPQHAHARAATPAARGPARLTIAGAVASLLACAAGGAFAADAPAVTGSDSLEEIVVTATASGVRKLDASYNIVSASLDEIQNANPASAAEMDGCDTWSCLAAAVNDKVSAAAAK